MTDNKKGEEKDPKEIGEPSLASTLEKITKTKGEVRLAKEGWKKVHEEAGLRYFEYDRLEAALDGVYRNLAPLSGIGQIQDPERVNSIWGTCTSLCSSIAMEISGLQEFEVSSGDWAVMESIPASGSGILADSTAVYEVNADILELPAIPPSVEEQIDPYIADQPEVEKELQGMLRGIDTDLESQYLAVRKAFQTPDRAGLSAAASHMRTLIWEIFRRLAPKEEVAAAPGFVQHPEKDSGVPTFRQQVAYILTGTADINGPQVDLVDELFRNLDSALGIFSGRAKTINKISNYQLKQEMARCERTLLTLLKNRKA